MLNLIKFSTFILCLAFCGSIYGSYDIHVNEYLVKDYCHADIIVTPNGNAGPFNISFYQVEFPDVVVKEFDNVSSNSSIEFTPFAGWGRIMVVIKDAFDCEYTELVSWTCNCRGISVELNESSITHPLTCNPSDRSGRYRVIGDIVEGGVGPFIYQWSDPFVAQTGFYFENFNHGPYTLTVTDFNGCTATEEIKMVAQNAPENVHYRVVPTCEGESNGELNFDFLSSIGSTQDFEVNIVPPFPSQVDYNEFNQSGVLRGAATNVPAGEYCVQIYDPGTQCEIEECYVVQGLEATEPFTYLEAESLQSIRKTCKGLSTGQVTIFATGGIPFNSVQIEEDGNFYPARSGEYIYRWSDIPSVTALDGFRSSLAEGTYYVTISDFCGNELSAEVFIPSYPGIEFEVDQTPGCQSDGGTIKIHSVTGGGDGNFMFPSQYAIQWEDGDDEWEVTNRSEDYHNFRITNLQTTCYEDFTVFLDNYPEIQVQTTIIEPCFIPLDDHQTLFAGLNENVGPIINEGGISTSIEWYDGEIDHPDEQFTADMGDPNQVSYFWNGQVGNSEFEFSPVDFSDGFNLNLKLLVKDNQFDCTDIESNHIQNKIFIQNNSNNTDICEITVTCGTINDPNFHNQEVNVDANFKECCFYVDCFHWECKCDYPTDLNPSFYQLTPMYDLDNPGNTPEFERNFDVVQEFLPNCRIIEDCPGEPGYDDYCNTANGSTLEKKRVPCPWSVENCNTENMVSPPIYNIHEFPDGSLFPIEFEILFNDGTECPDGYNPESDDDLSFCVNIPEGGGELVVARGFIDSHDDNGNIINNYVVSPWEEEPNPKNFNLDNSNATTFTINSENFPAIGGNHTGSAVYRFEFANETIFVSAIRCASAVLPPTTEKSYEINEKIHFEIFPNPSPGTINLFFRDIGQNDIFVVSDLKGKIFHESRIKDEALQLNLDKGVYFASLITEEGLETKRIVVF